MNPNAPRLVVGVSPHWRTGTGIPRLSYAHIAALLPAIAVAAVVFASDNAAILDADFGPVNTVISILTYHMGLDTGVLWFLGTLGTLALGVGTGILAEYGAQVVMRQPYKATDGHGALMGLLLAMMMPPTVPWWVLFIGVTVTIVIGKQVYGGLGGYPMHPVAVGWLVLLLSWPNHIYPVGTASIASAHVAVVALTALGGVVLVLLRFIRWEVPVGVLLGVGIGSLVFSSWLTGSMWDQWLQGHVIICAFFLATDHTSSPANRRARWLYAVGTGLLIVLVRAFGIWPDAVPFALLLMNVLNPLLDRWRPAVRRVLR